MKKLATIVLAGLVGLMAWTGAATAESGYGKQKVVYHVNGDNPKQQTGALRNIQNHINAVGAENLDVKVVLHGNGLGLLMSAKGDETLQTVVASLMSSPAPARWA